jgi:3-deoxy-D-manno-octulosonic-acid transferase
VWVHAVSVGEVLAATRLVAELEQALGDGWVIVVSTTTATGQALAAQRFGLGGRVFYYPLDFAWAVRAYLRALRPKMLVLMESELWPRMLAECRRAGIPVAVANARVSDRSFARGMRVRALCSRLLRLVRLFLAQSEEDARRLVAMGTRADSVLAVGNLKYDAAEPKRSNVAAWIREIAAGRSVVVAGSTVAGDPGPCEEELVADAWRQVMQEEPATLLVLAPRHPERFDEAAKHLQGFRFVRASAMEKTKDGPQPEAVLLDTIGDLASVYAIADVAFIGGSLAPRGGHNPLEASRCGVPVITGPSTRNFRAIYGALAAQQAVVTLETNEQLGPEMLALLMDRSAAKAMGERGRRVFKEQQGATARTAEALMKIIGQGESRFAEKVMQAQEARN